MTSACFAWPAERWAGELWVAAPGAGLAGANSVSPVVCPLPWSVGASAVRCEPEPTRPWTRAAPTASATAADTSARASLRRRDRRGRAAGASTRGRSRAGASGRLARSSQTSVSCPASSRGSVAGMGHLLLQPLEGPAEPGRTRGTADPEHPRGTRPVELEQDTQRDDLALGRREPLQRPLELRRRPFREDGLLELDRVAGERLDRKS